MTGSQTEDLDFYHACPTPTEVCTLVPKRDPDPGYKLMGYADVLASDDQCKTALDQQQIDTVALQDSKYKIGVFNEFFYGNYLGCNYLD